MSGGDRTDARIALLSLNKRTCEAHDHVYSQQMAVHSWIPLLLSFGGRLRHVGKIMLSILFFEKVLLHKE